MTVIRLYTKIINTSDFASKLVQSLISKGYSLNVICSKKTIDKFVTKKVNTENIHFSDLDQCSSLQFFNFDILLNLSLKFIPQFSSFNNFIEIFNLNDSALLNERINYFKFRGYPLKIFQNCNLNL
tara:strand:+ start:132 stop:509 length:378 start_codon:yes stop_codon:yes gene_type:complete